jgi:hypothetical protein
MTVAMRTPEAMQPDRALAYHLLRYVPNLVRDEWVNIGVLVFDPASGERRLRLIEEPEEYARVRRLHPQADEALLRGLRDDLEDRFSRAGELFPAHGAAPAEGNGRPDWLKLLGKWDDTLSNAVQLAQQKGGLRERPGFRNRVTLCGPCGAAAPCSTRRRARHPCGHAQVLRAGVEAGARLGTHREERARRGVHLFRRSHAH